jgi:hypothetical protein
MRRHRSARNGCKKKATPRLRIAGALRDPLLRSERGVAQRAHNDGRTHCDRPPSPPKRDRLVCPRLRQRPTND